MANPITYGIAFRHPSEGDTIDFFAAGPFQTVRVGDAVYGRVWKGSKAAFDAKYDDEIVAKVTQVAHSIEDAGAELIHRIVVYSELAGPLAHEEGKKDALAKARARTRRDVLGNGCPNRRETAGPTPTTRDEPTG